MVNSSILSLRDLNMFEDGTKAYLDRPKPNKPHAQTENAKLFFDGDSYSPGELLLKPSAVTPTGSLFGLFGLEAKGKLAKEPDLRLRSTTRISDEWVVLRAPCNGAFVRSTPHRANTAYRTWCLKIRRRRNMRWSVGKGKERSGFF